MKNVERDMDVLDFARKISTLTTDTHFAREFDEKYGQKNRRWWTCQREHMTVWCLHYPTEGIKGFEHTPSNSARTMYNNFSRPETLLWLAEALGENEQTITEIIDEIKDIDGCRTACSMVRNKISFERILDLMQRQC